MRESMPCSFVRMALQRELTLESIPAEGSLAICGYFEARTFSSLRLEMNRFRKSGSRT